MSCYAVWFCIRMLGDLIVRGLRACLMKPVLFNVLRLNPLISFLMKSKWSIGIALKTEYGKSTAVIIFRSEEGQSPRAIALQLNELLRGMVLYSDAWGFDSSWIARLFDEAGLIQRFKVESINKLFNEEQMEHWNRTKDRVWKEHGSNYRHRAAQDVSVIQETYNRIAKLV